MRRELRSQLWLLPSPHQGQNAQDSGSLLLARSVIDSQTSIFPSVKWEQSSALPLPPPTAEGSKRTQNHWVWHRGVWGQISNLLTFPQQITNIYLLDINRVLVLGGPVRLSGF